MMPCQSGSVPQQATTEDMAMLRKASEVTRDLLAPRASRYWIDMLASAAIGYAGLVAAIAAQTFAAVAIGAAVAVLALYRAGSFIHELSHLKASAVPGFRPAWNLLVGIPLLVPSFLYEGIHTLHHNRTKYGTAADPEYLPLALMRPHTLPVFLLASVLAPAMLLVRFAVLAPLSAFSPQLRAVVVERYSALAINPAFRRRPPEGDFRRQWQWSEAGASVWAITLLSLVATATLPLRAFLTFLAITAGVAVINQVRTLVAHLWENEGGAISVTAQYLDTVNVPPPALLPVLWAPVGLRYHALHHLLPSVPYHALGEAHRRMSGALAAESPYHQANHAGLFGLIAQLVGGAVDRNRVRQQEANARASASR